jgi:hypothetical protein
LHIQHSLKDLNMMKAGDVENRAAAAIKSCLDEVPFINAKQIRQNKRIGSALWFGLPP